MRSDKIEGQQVFWMIYCNLSELRLYFGFIMKIQEKDLKEMNGKKKKELVSANLKRVAEC